MGIKRAGNNSSIRFFMLFIFAPLAIALFSLNGCSGDVEKIKPFISTENLPVLSAVDFETKYIDSFKIQLYMKAPELQKFDVEGQPYMEFPKGILIVKYDSEGRVISRITADYAKQYEKEDKWEARNNVVAVNTQGDTLKTEFMIWEEKSGKIYSDKFVKIIMPDKIITGIGFNSDQNFQNTVVKDIQGIIYIDVNKNKQSGEVKPAGQEKPKENKALQFGN
jgi:LPS export ABC transporter protein LptC